MRNRRSRLIAALALAALGVGACGGRTQAPAPAARVEREAGSSTVRVVLSAVAAQRIGIQTAPVLAVPVGRRAAATLRIPFAAVLYDASGSAFTYTNPAPLTFVRMALRIDRIVGNVAYVTQGPPAGTRVVTVGGIELLGAQDGVGAQE